MRDVMAPDVEDPSWSRRASDRMKMVREEHADVPRRGLYLQDEPGGYRLWTFGGGRANNLLYRTEGGGTMKMPQRS